MSDSHTSFLLLLAYAGTLMVVIMTLVWWRQTYTRNAGIVDAWWSYNFGLLAILYFVMGNGEFWHAFFFTLIIVIWSARLGTHLLLRNTRHPAEDSRYRKLREEYGTREKFLMWRFFMYQAISNVLLSIPFLLATRITETNFSNWFYAGVIMAIVALVGETIADHQLKVFKQNPANAGKVCQSGLWNYSRHPNYFFEWLIWVSFALMAMDAPYGGLGWLSPMIMYYILNYVTGIPMLEELAVKTKGDSYRHYQQTTSAFIPWFKKSEP